MAECLVLGANGFIASHLVDALVARGHSVRSFGRLSGEPTYNSSPMVEFQVGDFLNEGDLTAALEGIEYVFHFISTTTPISAENDPLIDLDTNVRMSIKLFELCASASIKKVIFASTGGAIYGQTDTRLQSETDAPQPVSPYAIGKLSIEHFLRYFKVKKGLDSVSFRISNPYGERQPLNRKQGVIPIFLQHITDNQPLTILGDGSMVRDYVYVKDVVSMIADVFERPMQHGLYNLGSGQGASVNELVQAIEDITGKTAEISHQPVPSTFVHHVVLNTDRFEEEFGLRPATSLHDGLITTLEYIKQESSH